MCPRIKSSSSACSSPLKRRVGPRTRSSLCSSVVRISHKHRPPRGRHSDGDGASDLGKRSLCADLRLFPVLAIYTTYITDHARSHSRLTTQPGAAISLTPITDITRELHLGRQRLPEVVNCGGGARSAAAGYASPAQRGALSALALTFLRIMQIQMIAPISSFARCGFLVALLCLPPAIAGALNAARSCFETPARPFAGWTSGPTACDSFSLTRRADLQFVPEGCRVSERAQRATRVCHERRDVSGGLSPRLA